MTLSFAVTWDYRCPFARNAHEHVIAALEDGADWDVEFVPFSLTQVHVAEGEVDAWDNPAKANTLLAMQAGIVVRDRMPDLFLKAHTALFAARHDRGLDVRDPELVANVLDEVGVDSAAVLAEIKEGWPLTTFRKAHTDAVDSHRVWGVPTFIVGDQAAFIRFMHRPEGDAVQARQTIERVVDLLAWPDLNEFKHTSVPR
jgi:hypothetical protein